MRSMAEHQREDDQAYEHRAAAGDDHVELAKGEVADVWIRSIWSSACQFGAHFL